MPIYLYRLDLGWIFGYRALLLIHQGRRSGLLRETMLEVLLYNPATRESVVLTVENTGEKLTPQLVSTLGEPFLRGTERIRTDHAGVGLGLSIVKSITQAHDGTLTLTPRAAGGLCVTVQLPAAGDRAHMIARSSKAR